jgi:hypothetical protein
MLDSANGARRRDVSTRVTRTPHDELGLTDDDVQSMYRIALMARLIDEAAFRQNRMGRAPFVVPVSGHEGCQIGTAWAMRRGTDIWLPYYRDLAVVLVAGMTPYEVFLGIFSKADDPSSGGRQMPAHWGSRRLGVITGSSPIATQVPHAAGIAYAVKYRGEDAVVATWFGDGATSEGDWHEGLNFAGVHRLPVIFVCENNHYAISVPQSKQMAVRDVADRAAGWAEAATGPAIRDARTASRPNRAAAKLRPLGVMLAGILCRELPSLFSAVPDNLAAKFFRQSIQKACDSIERRESVGGDQCIRNRSILEDVNVEVHSRDFFDKFIESGHRVARFILSPVKLLDVRLKKRPIGGDVSREKLDSILDMGGAISRITGCNVGRR